MGPFPNKRSYLELNINTCIPTGWQPNVDRVLWKGMNERRGGLGTFAMNQIHTNQTRV